MKLYMMRHGAYASSDLTKALTPAGEDDVRRMASYLNERGFSIGQIWHSPKKRAVQTAEILGRVLGCDNFQERDDLTPNAKPDQVIFDVEKCNQDLAIVSHLPFIPCFLSMLFPDMPTSIMFPTCAVAVIENRDGEWSFSEIISLDSI